MAQNFNRGFSRPGSSLAKVSALLLSSQTVVLNVVGLSVPKPTIPAIVVTKCFKGRSSHVAILRVLHSVSIVDVDISCWSLLRQITGQFDKQITYPGRLFILHSVLTFISDHAQYFCRTEVTNPTCISRSN
jgi:hypothetical protein